MVQALLRGMSPVQTHALLYACLLGGKGSVVQSPRGSEMMRSSVVHLFDTLPLRCQVRSHGHSELHVTITEAGLIG